jgi:ABC-type transport system involved in cytochrome c biogenesis permease subunit
MMEGLLHIAKAIYVLNAVTLPILWFIIPWVAIGFSLVASMLALFDKRRVALFFGVCVPLLIFILIGGQWILTLKPPMSTVSDTRLWYSFFASLAALFTYLRWKYRWVISFSTVLVSVFLILAMRSGNLSDATLVPALQSPWFMPHVTVYMFSYSLMGCAFLIGMVALFKKQSALEMLKSADTLVYIGMAFLTFGMLSGSIWAKDAWGHFWSWDPKETWALITWLVYMLYIHLRIYRKGSVRLLCVLLIFAFACLQMCWWGVNLLPSAADSVHVY